jgi:hypothetical protein
MDPWLEGHLWPDAHHILAVVIKELLAPQVSPKYLVHTDVYTVTDTSPEEDVGIMYPDVEVLRKEVKEPAQGYTSAGLPPLTPVTISVPATRTIEVRVPTVEIRDRRNNLLVTAIEILSPVNKRKPGLQPYIEKRERLHEAGVHLLEIDLIRRGQRPFVHPYLPKSHYLVSLMRAGEGSTDLWAFNVQDSLPVVPVPLKAPDTDAVLDLGKALDLIYDRSLYHSAIDYEEAPPPPAFGKEEEKWIREKVKAVS